MSHSFSQRLAARIFSAFIWNREARRAFRNALMHDYRAEIKELRAELTRCRNELQCLAPRTPEKPVSAPVPKVPSYLIAGENNRIIIIENGEERLLGGNERIPGLDIAICGDNNEIRIHRPCTIERVSIQIGVPAANSKNNGVQIEIGEKSTFVGMYVRCAAGERQFLRFGRGSRIWGGEIILDETSGCIIGNDVNCSNSIHIWGSDGHAILDKNNPTKILNEVSGPITVGDHTWIGQAVRLQKNARIPANSIIAAAAVVTKAFEEEYTIIGGFPAKVIKRNCLRDPETLNALTRKRKIEAEQHNSKI